MRTPGHDLEQVRGLLYAEGVIRDGESPAELRCEGDHCVRLLMEEELVKKRWAKRDSVTSSACGVCGASSLARLEELAQPILSDLHWSCATMCSAPGQLREKQLLFEETGAVHGAAFFDRQGTRLQCREDVGRSETSTGKTQFQSRFHNHCIGTRDTELALTPSTHGALR